MCGIAGIINLDGKHVDSSVLLAMNAAITHRGPDGDGVFTHNGVGIAHHRLAIIDPKAGIQPFFNDDQSIALTYNGEIYNYREIENELKDEFDFRTRSDTEVLVRAYEKWGIDCLDRFRGMFAFGLYDANNQTFYLVRDRVGIKPLYYYNDGERLVFASELSAILSLKSIPREINPAAVSGFFRYQYVPTPLSIYKNLYKLEAGHFLKIDLNSSTVSNHRYWQLHVNPTERSENDWLEELNHTLDETVNIYVRSDVPFGAFLSGGVDSSIVTAIMTGHLNEPVRTFSIGFEEREYSELPYAAQVSQIVGTNHYERVVSYNMAADLLQKIARHFGEPFSDSSAVPTYYVSKEAASQVKMVLSGDGGDELFGGYNTYPMLFKEYTNQPNKAAVLVGRGLVTFIPYWRLRNFASRWSESFEDRHNTQMEIFRQDNLPQLLETRTPVAPRVEFDVKWAKTDIDPITWAQARDFKMYMMDDILTKVDRMSMANSLEVRVPLLDHKVVELAFQLPLSLRLRANGNSVQSKYILKKSAERFYTREFLDRKKQGFGIPLAEWCRGPLRSLIEFGLREHQNPVFDWINFDRTQNILDAFYKGHGNHAAQIWALMMFDMWMHNVHLSNATA